MSFWLLIMATKNGNLSDISAIAQLFSANYIAIIRTIKLKNMKQYHLNIYVNLVFQRYNNSYLLTVLFIYQVIFVTRLVTNNQ